MRQFFTPSYAARLADCGTARFERAARDLGFKPRCLVDDRPAFSLAQCLRIYERIFLEDSPNAGTIEVDVPVEPDGDDDAK